MVFISEKRPDSHTLRELLKMKVTKFKRLEHFDYPYHYLFDNGSNNMKHCVGIVILKTDKAKEKFKKYLKEDNFKKIKLMFDKKQVAKIR